METQTTELIGNRPDGSKIVRNFFHNPKVNHMANAHAHFTKDERKQAKLNAK